MHFRRTVLLLCSGSTSTSSSSSQVYSMLLCTQQFCNFQCRNELQLHSVSSLCHTCIYLPHSVWAIHRTATEDTNLSHSRGRGARQRRLRARVQQPDSLSERRCRRRSPVRLFGQRRERKREKGKTGGLLDVRQGID